MTTRSYELTEAMSRLINTQPGFAVMLLELLVIQEGDASKPGFPVPTAGTDGRRLFINYPWFAKLSLEERVFLLCHEVCHVVLNHPARGKLYHDRGIGPDLKEYKPGKMNKAMDYIINDWIVQSGNKHMPQGGMLNPQFTMQDVADEVYCKLDDDEDDEGNFDVHLDPADDAATQADIQRAAKSAIAAAKAQGKLPAGMERLLEGICEPQVIWRDQLRMSVSASAGRDDATWARPNRKRLAVPPHIYFPGTCANRAGTVVVYGDTSGSVSDKEWAHFFGEVSSIVEELKPEQTWLGSCDHEAYDPVLIESSDDVRRYKAQGGGGTNMPAIFGKLAAMELRPDVLVILTDGYTDFGSPPPYDVIWVMTTDVVAPFGKNLRININQ
jgi:predicted metal-dependent peptidase